MVYVLPAQPTYKNREADPRGLWNAIAGNAKILARAGGFVV
jgi:hypothetical protein